MKTKHFLVALPLLIMSSCKTSSLPSGMYLQNFRATPKPIYDGSNKSSLKIAVGYSSLHINTNPLANPPAGNSNIEFESNVQSGFMEVVYGESKKAFSYAFGLLGAAGEYNANSSWLPGANSNFSTFGVGAKANCSYDINLKRLTFRIAQLQLGISQDFGEYSNMRKRFIDYDQGKNDWFRFVHPRNALVWNASISNIIICRLGENGRLRLAVEAGIIAGFEN